MDHDGKGKLRCPVYTKSHGRVKLFPSSVSSPDGAGRELAGRGTTYYIHRWGLYIEKVRNAGGISLYDISEIGPFPISVCAPGERVYHDIEGSRENNALLSIDADIGKVAWSDDEAKAMSSRLDKLRILSANDEITDVERVSARVEMEDIEARLGIAEAIGGDSARPSGEGDLESRVLSFVVSALETNGGNYPMAQLRRMMKSDYDLYEAMGPVRKFAAENSDVVSLDKIGGKWMFVLKPGARDILEGKAQVSSSASDAEKAFSGPKQWVYFDMNGDEKLSIDNARAAFHSIVDARVGRTLLPEEERFLQVLGWALEDDFTKSG